MSTQMQFAPFRSFNDIVGIAENYAVPDFKDLARLSNRITNNLLVSVIYFYILNFKIKV
jgi:hypothetical protein